MLIAPARDNTEINSRSAIDPEGEGIIGCEATVLMDAGAYSGETGFPTSMISYTLGGVYELEAVWLASQAIYTNIPPARFFRSRNGVYSSSALERTHTSDPSDRRNGPNGVQEAQRRRDGLPGPLASAMTATSWGRSDRPHLYPECCKHHVPPSHRGGWAPSVRSAVRRSQGGGWPVRLCWSDTSTANLTRTAASQSLPQVRKSAPVRRCRAFCRASPTHGVSM